MTTRTTRFLCKFSGQGSTVGWDHKHNVSFAFHILSSRFLFDKGSMEYLYFKKKVAEMRRDLLRSENTPDNGRFTFCQITVYLRKG